MIWSSLQLNYRHYHGKARKNSKEALTTEFLTNRAHLHIAADEANDRLILLESHHLYGKYRTDDYRLDSGVQEWICDKAVARKDLLSSDWTKVR